MARVERVVINPRRGKSTHERAVLITSRPPDKASPADLLAANRGHWSIENRSHWVRDVTFDEDRCQIRTGRAPRMMVILRNLAIALIRLLDFRWVPQGLRHFARRSSLALSALRL